MPDLSESDRAWWIRGGYEMRDRDEEDSLAHEKLHAVVSHIERTQDRKRDLLLFGAMYGGGIPPAGGGMAVDQYIRTTPGNRGNLSLNVTRNVVDAVTSRVFSKAEPKLTYVTEGGSFEKQDNAKKLELGVEGAFYNADAYDKFVDCGRDGCVFGTGFVKVFPDKDIRKVRVMRRMPWEVVFDNGESLYEPGNDDELRCLYTACYWDKFRLAHYAKIGQMASSLDIEDKCQHILRLGGERDEDAEFGYQQVALRVRVEEAWHLPSGVGAPDGRHVIAVHGKTLCDESWDGGCPGRPWTFAWYRWSKPIVGFYGQGIVEIGQGIQAEINKLVREIQNGHHLIKGSWLVEQNSKVVTAHINNDLSRIMKYQGTKPEYQAPAIISPEVYEHLWALVAKYYEISGINQQTAQAQKPADLKSGEAQRVYADQQTETLLEKGKRFARFVRQCGQLVVDAAKELAEDGPYEVRAFADDGFETIDWKELDDPDGYELRVHETSNMPGTPSGKIELANELAGLPGADFDGADILEIIGMPDMLQKTREKQASRKLVEKKVGAMIREGTPYEPHGFLNLPEAVIIATQLRNLAECKDVPSDRLDLVQDFITKCVALPEYAQQMQQQEQAAAAAQGQQQQPGQPQQAPQMAGAQGLAA